MAGEAAVEFVQFGQDPRGPFIVERPIGRHHHPTGRPIEKLRRQMRFQRLDCGRNRSLGHLEGSRRLGKIAGLDHSGEDAHGR
jgi:hypothetical protein